MTGIRHRNSLDSIRQARFAGNYRAENSDEEEEGGEGLYPNLDDDDDNDPDYQPPISSNAGVLRADDNTSESSEEPVPQNEPSWFGNFGLKTILILPILLGIFLPVITSLSGIEFSSQSLTKMLFEILPEFSTQSEQLNQLYTSHQSWLCEPKFNEIKRNILQKLEDRERADPLTIFFLTPPSLIIPVYQFSTQLSEKFAAFSKGSSIMVDANHPLALTESTRGVVVSNFTSLPWSEAQVYMQFCDNDNAPFPNTVFIFVAEKSLACDPKRPDRAVEEVIVGRWRGEVEVETIEALAARISAVAVCIT